MDAMIEGGANGLMAAKMGISVYEMEKRVVRYTDLRPCYNAFIDTRSPGSEKKENFTIIGPGVAENPDQFVHITERHGFNIGGARQPPNCVNSQHSHDTAEVFVVHTGKWRFNIGENGEDVQVFAGPGDVITLPTNMFRGFTNVGDDVGYLFAVLGGDDAGHVLWAPYVFDMAKDYGLVLLESGKLIDTAAGQSVPEGVKQMPKTTAEQVANAYIPTLAEAESLIWRSEDLQETNLRPIIDPDGLFGWDHGFTLARLDIAIGDSLPAEAVGFPEVLFIHSGTLKLKWEGGELLLGKGDTITVPSGLKRQMSSEVGTSLYRVRGV
jgi:mannose-6-phosphate isomerase-like protein (cupin superfamily)